MKRQIPYHGNWSVYEYDGVTDCEERNDLRFLFLLMDLSEVPYTVLHHTDRHLTQVQIFQLTPEHKEARDGGEFYWPWGHPDNGRWFQVGPMATARRAWSAWLAGTLAEFRFNAAVPTYAPV